MIEANTTTRIDRCDRQRHGLGPLEVGLGLGRRVLRQRGVAGELGAVTGRRAELGPDPVDEVDRLLVGRIEPDHDVGRAPIGADEAGIAGLGVADRPGDFRVTLERGERRGDRRLVVRARRVARGSRPEQHDEAAPTDAELLGQGLVDGGRLGGRVEPAARAQVARRLDPEEPEGDGDEDRDEGDRAAEAIDECSPAAEHAAVLLARPAASRPGYLRWERR